MKRVLVVILLASCTKAMPPLAPEPVPTPVVAACPAGVLIQMVDGPPPGSFLRPGDMVILSVKFSLPADAYPTSVDAGLVWPDRKGGSSGVACGSVRMTRVRQIDWLVCSVQIDREKFDSQFSGVAGPIDVGFQIFNWPTESHPGEVFCYQRFRTGYIYRP